MPCGHFCRIYKYDIIAGYTSILLRFMQLESPPCIQPHQDSAESQATRHAHFDRKTFYCLQSLAPNEFFSLTSHFTYIQQIACIPNTQRPSTADVPRKPCPSWDTVSNHITSNVNKAGKSKIDFECSFNVIKS